MRWLFSWFDPAGAQEATQALMAEGSDVFIFTEDTPTVIQTAAEQGYPSFSHYASMYEFSPDTVVSGQLTDWGTIYIDFVKGAMEGTYTNESLQDVDYIWLYAEGASVPGAKEGMIINPVYEDALKGYMVNDPELGEISVYDLVLARVDAMTNGDFEPFTGPIV